MSFSGDGLLQLFAEAGENGASAEVSADTHGGGQTENTLPTVTDGGKARTENGAEKPKTAGDGEKSEKSGGGEKRRTEETDRGLFDSVRESFGERMKNAEAEAVLASWRSEEQATREIYPSFSMRDEIINEPMFGTLLKSGVGVRRAYECVHLEEIIGSAIRYAVTDIGRRSALKPRLQSARPGENSVLDRAASVTRKDVNSLTDRDIRRILSEVSKGAKISFG